MKVYNVLINSGKMTSSQLFEKEEDAIDYVKWLEDGQQRLEGHGMVHIFHYDGVEVVNPPFFIEGKRIYCSRAVNGLSDVYTWRTVYEQELG